jgi:hypothetical protein
MATAIINGRRVDLPTTTTDREIREVGRIAPGRNLIRRTREGNYLVPLGTTVEVDDGDRFLDAPARVKGGEERR